MSIDMQAQAPAGKSWGTLTLGSVAMQLATAPCGC
jgi:hypothetical protein